MRVRNVRHRRLLRYWRREARAGRVPAKGYGGRDAQYLRQRGEWLRGHPNGWDDLDRYIAETY